MRKHNVNSVVNGGEVWAINRDVRKADQRAVVHFHFKCAGITGRDGKNGVQPVSCRQLEQYLSGEGENGDVEGICSLY